MAVAFQGTTTTINKRVSRVSGRRRYSRTACIWSNGGSCVLAQRCLCRFSSHYYWLPLSRLIESGWHRYCHLVILFDRSVRGPPFVDSRPLPSVSNLFLHRRTQKPPAVRNVSADTSTAWFAATVFWQHALNGEAERQHVGDQEDQHIVSWRRAADAVEDGGGIGGR